MPPVKVAGWNEFYEKLCSDYGLTREQHFWLHDKSKKWIIHHSGIMAIASKEKFKTHLIPLLDPQYAPAPPGKADASHLLYGCVAYKPGTRKFSVYIKWLNLLLVDEETESCNMPNAEMVFSFKAEYAAINVGEGDASNFREGYKHTIVSKRAEDRAILELVQAKYQYAIMTEQDATVMDGASSFSAPQPAAPEPESDGKAEAAAEFAKFEGIKKELKKWLAGVGVDAARKYLDGIAKTIDETLSKHHADELRGILTMAEATQKAIEEDKAKKAAAEEKAAAKSAAAKLKQEEKKPEALPKPEPKKEEPAKPKMGLVPPPPTGIPEEFIGGATQAQIDFAAEVCKQIKACTDSFKMSTVGAEHGANIKALPMGLQAYIKTVGAARREEIKAARENNGGKHETAS